MGPAHAGAAFNVLLDKSEDLRQEHAAEIEEGDEGRDGDASREGDGVMRVKVVGKRVA